MQRWRDLLEQLDALSQGQGILSEDEIIEFENSTSITLPQDYKEFCQVFGTGIFGDFAIVECPSLDFLDFGETIISRLKEDIERSPSKDPEWDKEVAALLDSVLIFGGDVNWNNVALWDLRTYNESDKNYDIYWMSTSLDDDDLYCIGRNFSEFVQDFCLGTKAFEKLPPSQHPEPGSVHQTFTCLGASKRQSGHYPLEWTQEVRQFRGMGFE